MTTEDIACDVQEQSCNCIYKLGSITAIIALLGLIFDIIIGSFITGGNLSSLPQTATERFAEFHKNWLLGLYNLDFLNLLIQLMLVPPFVALYAANRKVRGEIALLAMIIFLVGSTILVINNSALSMLELSNKYASATSETQKNLFAAAGEGMLVRGSHGSLNMFFGFALPNLAGFIISLLMLWGKFFGKATSYFGIIGSAWMLIYIFLVTFSPAVKSMATAFAAPGGILLLVWIILFTMKFFQLGFLKK